MQIRYVRLYVGVSLHPITHVYIYIYMYVYAYMHKWLKSCLCFLRKMPWRIYILKLPVYPRPPSTRNPASETVPCETESLEFPRDPKLGSFS